ncbi:F0F1 ATP synthase subunit gamma [Gammaproteobacteria bacterium]|nr:F0F1 ATP synthase subunit gamma [Gammaproteobacteria bacterium]
MSGAKEIRGKIKSIKNTQKITKAMEMVAASKMRRAMDRMVSSRPYVTNIRRVVWRMSQAKLEYQHPYTLERDVKRVGYIVVTSDRGLCGGLNTNLLRALTADIRQKQEDGVELDFAVFGNKGLAFFKRFGGNLVAHSTNLGDAPTMESILGTVKVMIDRYDRGEIDRMYIVFNDFINTMTQQPTVQQLLPATGLDVAPEGETISSSWDYIYEPSAQPVLERVMARYIETLIYQGVVENAACEQSARMVAMKAASDNAGNLIDELQLVYNKARQAAITQEISEIVGGAAAV